MADQNQTEPLDLGQIEDSSPSNEPDVTVNSGIGTNCPTVHNDSMDNKSSADEDEGVNGRMNRTINEESGNEINGKIIDDEDDGKEGSGKIGTCIDTQGTGNNKDNETVSLDADVTTEKEDNTVEKRSCKVISSGKDMINSETNEEVTQKGKEGEKDRGKNETSDTGHTEKTNADETHKGESDENKTGNEETKEIIGKPADERHDQASYNWSSETNNDGKDVVPVKVNEDETDANSKERSDKTFEEDSSLNEEGNDSENSYGRMITEMNRQEAVIKASNDESIHESTVYNEDKNRQKDGAMACPIESLEADENPLGKKTFKLFKKHIPKRVRIKMPTINTKKFKDVLTRKFKDSNDTHRDNKRIQDENKKLKKKPQKIINQTQEENDGTTEKGDTTVEKMTCEEINRGNDTTRSKTNKDKTQKGKDRGNDKWENETSDIGYTEKSNAVTEETHNGEIGDNKIGNEETDVIVGKTANEEASFSGKVETNNDRKDFVTEKVNDDQTDANAKERSDNTFQEDSSSNEEGNDSEKPDERMITEMDRQEPARKASHDEAIPESTVYNDDTNRQKDETRACSIESPEADEKTHDKKGWKSMIKKHMPTIGPVKVPTLIKKRDNKPIQDEKKKLKKRPQESTNQTLEKKESYANALNKTTESLLARDQELEESQSVIQQINADISQLNAQMQQLHEEKSDLLLRLSKVASAQLTQNNPNIADLSDANRPTKLADQFSELYDNEYTDAIDELKEQQCIEEPAAIENMLTLLQAANDECVEMARKQDDGIKCLTTFSFKIDQYPILRERSILTDPSDNEHPKVQTTADQETDEVTIEIQLPVEHRKSLFDIRTLCATKVEEEYSMSEIIASKIALQRGITPESSHKMLAYITKCANLCWYMAMKEPPVFVGFHTVVDGELTNKETYRPYTKAGELLDFVVWPPLYLYKDGPLLCKGVAQGK